MEIVVKPAAQKNLVDVYFNLNGATLYVLYSQPAVDSRVGLGMDFHSQKVSYDNFRYEELEVK